MENLSVALSLLTFLGLGSAFIQHMTSKRASIKVSLERDEVEDKRG